MKWGLKGGISIYADSGPPRYVLWCYGCICHEVLTFIQVGCGHTVSPSILKTHGPKKQPWPGIKPDFDMCVLKLQYRFLFLAGFWHVFKIAVQTTDFEGRHLDTLGPFIYHVSTCKGGGGLEMSIFAYF